MQFKDCFSWSEFDWEREIRKDDARVSAYIAELPKYIDLPGEDGILMRTIKRRLGSDREDEEWGPVPYEESAEDQDMQPFPDSENWRAAPGGPVYHNCSVLVRDFILGAATCPQEEVRPRVMRILTIYGQLMARSADLIDMSLEVERSRQEMEDCDIPDNLRVAIVKRLLSFQNNLTRELRLLEAESPELRAHADAHMEASGMMHDYLIDLLYAFRKSMEDNEPPF